MVGGGQLGVCHAGPRVARNNPLWSVPVAGVETQHCCRRTTHSSPLGSVCVGAARVPRAVPSQRPIRPLVAHTGHVTRAEGDSESARLQQPADSAQEARLLLGRRQLLQTAAAGAAVWAAGGPPPAAAAAGGAGATDLEARLDASISEFTLANGMHFIVMQRHKAPIVSCHVHANVGAFDEQPGLTGLAHFLEHMTFKGTARLGSTDVRREAFALDALDDAFYSMRAARDAGATREAARLAAQMPQLQAAAERFVVPNAYGVLLDQHGAINLNATTSHDATRFFVSLPANKLELWFLLESERFMAPVWRQLYTEKRVVAEERRMRTDNAPMGKFQEDFAKEVFANNYGRPVVGWAEDLDRVGRAEVAAFHGRHYTPQNLSVTLVGDIDPLQAYSYAEKYFGRWQCAAGSVCALPSRPSEPLARPHGAAMQFQRPERAGPAVMHAYYRPGVSHDDAVTLDIIRDMMSGSRTGRLHRALVETDQAISASAASSTPGDKHPSIFMMYGNAREEGAMRDVHATLQHEAVRLATDGATRAELQKVKKAQRMDLLDTMGYTSSLAEALATSHAMTGSWRTIPANLARAEATTSADIQEVAARIFVPDNCFTGLVLPLRD